MDPAVRLFLDGEVRAIPVGDRRRIQWYLYFKWNPHLSN